HFPELGCCHFLYGSDTPHAGERGFLYRLCQTPVLRLPASCCVNRGSFLVCPKLKTGYSVLSRQSPGIKTSGLAHPDIAGFYPQHPVILYALWRFALYRPRLTVNQNDGWESG